MSMSTDTREALAALPCPFCGGADGTDEQGETYRWRRWACPCGAKGPDVRCQITGSGNGGVKEARELAIREWNARAALATQPAQPSLAGLPFAEAKARIESLNEADAKGLAISLLIQNGIMEKYAAQPSAQGEVVAWDKATERREVQAWRDWAWKKEGDPIGLMAGQLASMEGWLARAKLASAPAAPASAQGEAVAWLVEWKAHGHGPQWWGFNHAPGKNATWCSDANNAIRFARKEDAERMRLHIIAVAGLTGRHEYERSVSVTEHMWEGPCRAN